MGLQQSVSTPTDCNFLPEDADEEMRKKVERKLILISELNFKSPQSAIIPTFTARSFTR